MADFANKPKEKAEDNLNYESNKRSKKVEKFASLVQRSMNMGRDIDLGDLKLLQDEYLKLKETGYNTSDLDYKIDRIKKNYQITKEEFDYMNATEHINSIFALKSLINFHYKNKIKEFYLPFKIKLIDLNLFYNVHITK